MTTRFEELDALSSTELHDRAVRYAERHGDLKFLWRLWQELPAAQVAANQEGEADVDVQHVLGLLADTFRAGESGPLADALRPFYIDYLEQHPDA
jgi:hypothetical protein